MGLRHMLWNIERIRIYIGVIVFLLILVFVPNYLMTPEKAEKAIEVSGDCKTLCLNALIKEQDLSNGPCLSDSSPNWKHPDWVCDVAHDPREAADNDPSNQCQEYREGRAGHFVELDTGCKIIKVL